jgi:hypothetical protein
MKKVVNVEVVQASRCIQTGKEIITLLLEYPRAIHAQLLTHRVFSKNSSSTRAVPIEKAIQQIEENPAQFLWTEKQKGMQGTLITEDDPLYQGAERIHSYAKESAVRMARCQDEAGIHKQNAGRYLEPFQNIKVLLTSTEWDNWDWLRVDADAQPEITQLANEIKLARENAVYTNLETDEWHIPFITRKRDAKGKLLYFHPDTNKELKLNEAIEISLSCNAQTSYRVNDTSETKAKNIVGILFDGKKVHASPSEHIASPIGLIDTTGVGSFQEALDLLPEGVTHWDRKGTPWSGNFNRWLQYRQLIPNHDGALIHE